MKKLVSLNDSRFSSFKENEIQKISKIVGGANTMATGPGELPGPNNDIWTFQGDEYNWDTKHTIYFKLRTKGY